MADYLTSAGLVEALDRRAEMRAIQQRQMALQAARLAAEQAAARQAQEETGEGAGSPPAPVANSNADARAQALEKVERFKALNPNPATKPHRARGRPRKGSRG